MSSRCIGCADIDAILFECMESCCLMKNVEGEAKVIVKILELIGGHFWLKVILV